MAPARGPTSRRAISASDLPLCRTEATRIEEIVDAARDDRAEEHPEEPGSEAELGREDRADQRARAGDGREMVAEEDPLVRGVVVVPSLRAWAGVCAAVVERQDLGGDEGAVITVGQGDKKQGADDDRDPRSFHPRRQRLYIIAQGKTRLRRGGRRPDGPSLGCRGAGPGRNGLLGPKPIDDPDQDEPTHDKDP